MDKMFVYRTEKFISALGSVESSHYFILEADNLGELYSDTFHPDKYHTDPPLPHLRAVAQFSNKRIQSN
jgi:hypothetical protein